MVLNNLYVCVFRITV